ncbi:MAG: SIMPL domain-containing protein [Nannocystaceae bacterium]|nr:SIMPL domain-containing protein [Nannocystaceae bacterium]
MIAAAWIPASTWERVKTKPKERVLQVTGSAKRRIVSDTIEWTAVVDTRDPDRVGAYRRLHADVDKTVAYLAAQGIPKEQIRVSSATLQELTRSEIVGSGDERYERQVPDGFAAYQNVTVRSTDVATVERVSREVTQLLESGISVSSSSPAYFYTKLSELKIEMLAEASKDARVRAENVLEAAGGGAIARLRSADMGVINVNPPNSTSTSWDGNNDTTSLEKDIITIVHASFELGDE